MGERGYLALVAAIEGEPVEGVARRVAVEGTRGARHGLALLQRQQTQPLHRLFLCWSQ